MSFRWVVTVSAAILLAGCMEPKGIYHTVQRGQTLYRIAHTYDLEESYLARINGIDDPSRLRAGDRLFIPGAERSRPVPVTVPDAVPVSTAQAPPPAKSSIVPRPAAAKTASVIPTKPATSPPVKPVASPLPAKPPAAKVAKTITARTSPDPKPSQAPKEKPPKVSSHQAKSPESVKGKFSWPLRGTILRPFGIRGSQTCNGMEIAAPEGTPVTAAAAGRVTYSSDGIRGYGNLIIIRHDDSFFTVYGFNQKSLVAAGNFVSRGQQIALSGKSPDGGKPRLHFEIRRGKTAVDPIFYLP